MRSHVVEEGRPHLWLLDAIRPRLQLGISQGQERYGLGVARGGQNLIAGVVDPQRLFQPFQWAFIAQCQDWFDAGAGCCQVALGQPAARQTGLWFGR